MHFDNPEPTQGRPVMDNTTPMSAKEYDKGINKTIPFYGEFYEQTMDIVEQCEFSSIAWLDLGCGTGTMEKAAQTRFPNAEFVLVDPSEQMLAQAKMKLMNENITYLCQSSEDISFSDRFDVVTAIQSHHYFQKEQRERAVQNVWQALKTGGVFLSFENVIPEDEELKSFELLRWGRYQQRQGKTAQETKEHNARCGVNYFPLTVTQHIELLRKTGFQNVYVFWRSYMQMGIMGMKYENINCSNQRKIHTF